MSDIQDALLRIYRLEGDPTDADPLLLSVTLPYPMQIKKVWPYVPPKDAVVNEFPCFINTWSVRGVEYGSALRRTQYAVHARLVCFDVDADKAAAIAASFQEPLLDRFASNLKLSGLRDWMVNTLRFEGEQPVVFQDLSEAAGRTVLGLDFFIDITHSSASSNAGGAPPSWA
jgi:hypothetical protein